LPSTHDDAGSREFDPRGPAPPGFDGPADAESESEYDCRFDSRGPGAPPTGAGFSCRSLDGLGVLTDAESEFIISAVCLSEVFDGDF
jgi:hypothetical protein